MKGEIVDFLKKNKGTIFSCLAGAGVIGTAIVSYKAGKKDSYKHTDKDRLINKIPTISLTAFTLLCIFASDRCHRLSYAALIALYSSLDTNYDKLNEVIEGELDEKQLAKVKKCFMPDIPDDMVSNDPEKQLFYLAYMNSGEYFESTIEDVRRFFNIVNRQYVMTGRITLNDILTIFGLDRVKGGDEFIYKNRNKSGWIEFIPDLIVLEDGLECYHLSMQIV